MHAHPRSTLRFHPAAGTTSTIHVTVGGTRFRDTRLAVEVRVTEVSRDGTARCQLSVTGVDAPDGGPLDMDGIAGAYSGFVIATSRGTVVKHQFSSANKLSWGLHPFFTQWIWDLAPTLPAEPIGVGARWRVERKTWKQTYEDVSAPVDYRLAAFDGRRATIEASITESAAPQTLFLTSAGSSDHGRLLRMKGQGKARLEIDLGGPPLAFGHSMVEVQERIFFSSRGQESERDSTERVDLDIQP
jgi:hypothetical protein